MVVVNGFVGDEDAKFVLAGGGGGLVGTPERVGERADAAFVNNLFQRSPLPERPGLSPLVLAALSDRNPSLTSFEFFSEARLETDPRRRIVLSSEKLRSGFFCMVGESGVWVNVVGRDVFVGSHLSFIHTHFTACLHHGLATRVQHAMH